MVSGKVGPGLVYVKAYDPVLTKEILEEVYGGFCERFSFLQEKRWAGNKGAPMLPP